MTTDPDFEDLYAYHPLDFPPRSLHMGPSASDMDATGMAYFRIGKATVIRIARRLSTGDVYIYRKGQQTLVHTSRAWALLDDGE